MAESLTWLHLPLLEFTRWVWKSEFWLPDPLSASAAGRCEIPLAELLDDERVELPLRAGGEQRMLDTVRHVLQGPSYCAYLVRSLPAGGADVGGADAGDAYQDTYYTAFARDENAVLVTVQAEQVSLAQVATTAMAQGLADQLPRIPAVLAPRFELAATAAEVLVGGIRRNAPERTLRSAMASAGVPAEIAEQFAAGEAAVTGFGSIAALAFDSTDATPPRLSARTASWTETRAGALLSTTTRSRGVVIEPLTVPSAARAVAEVMSSLG